MTDQPILSPKEELIELRKRLSVARTAQAKAKQAKVHLIAQVIEMLPYQAFDEIEKAEATNVENLEAEIRQKAVALFNADPGKDKHPIPGVDIRETTAITYDPKTAKTYAVKHLMFLELDKKAFEKFAKDHHDKDEELDFVEVKTEPSATIATDLSKYD